MFEQILTPSDFVNDINMVFESAMPAVIIEGELTNFKISRQKWVYFDLKDDQSSVKFFGSVYQIKAPLQDGMMLRVLGIPRMSNLYGFSLSIQAIEYSGQGSIKKSQAIIQQQLASEGLFSNDRKRQLTKYPRRLGLISSFESAAYADFIKIAKSRWPLCEIVAKDTVVQGFEAPDSLCEAIQRMNMAEVDVIVLTRGGGSADDLQAFNSEAVVRAVAACRVPIVVAIGHEVDICLAELAADVRASTPSNAAEIVLPSIEAEIRHLEDVGRHINQQVDSVIKYVKANITSSKEYLNQALAHQLNGLRLYMKSCNIIVASLNPVSIYEKGFVKVLADHKNIGKISTKDYSTGDLIRLRFMDGTIDAIVEKIT